MERQNFPHFREATECITKDTILQGTEIVLEIIPLGLINMLTEMAIAKMGANTHCVITYCGVLIFMAANQHIVKVQFYGNVLAAIYFS